MEIIGDFRPKKKLNLKDILIIFLFFLLVVTVTAGTYFSRTKITYKNKAAEREQKNILNKIQWNEEKINKPINNEPLKVNITKKGAKITSSLPVTGQWEDYTVKVVTNDRFTDPYINGVTAVQSMNDGKLFFGTYDYFGINEPNDEDWSNLTYYDLNLQYSTPINFFTQTLGDPYEIYFGNDYTSGGKIVRMKTDNTFELIVDPTDLYGYLRYVKVAPYKDNNGIAAYRSSSTLGELYYVEQGTLRKWFTPSRYCGQSLVADQIRTIVTDSNGERNTYGVITEYNGCSAHTFLYQFIFSSNPDVPLEIIKLGEITGPVGGGTGGSNNKQSFISRRLDDPNQKILYIGPPEQPGNNDFFTIPYLYDDGQNMEAFGYNISSTWIYDFSAQLKPNNETDHLWFAAKELYGIYLGRQFDNGQGNFVGTTDTTILANPYIHSITSNSISNKIYSGHSNTPNQFNNAMITIFEGPLPTPTSTPTPAPSQQISLNTGWNWITLRAIPNDPQLTSVLSSINGLYDMVQSETGVYSSWLPPQFNTLTELTAGSMYLIHITSPATLSLYGPLIPTTQPINLHQGWNWIGYYRSDTMPIEQALASIAGNYQRVLSQDAYYDPSNPGISSLLYLIPDQGYMLYSNITQTLIYPAGGNTPVQLPKPISCTKIITNLYTNIYTNLSFLGFNLEKGSVRLLTPQGVVAGCGQIKQNQLTITRAFGQETINGSTYPGFQNNENVKMEIFDDRARSLGIFATNFNYRSDDQLYSIQVLIPSPSFCKVGQTKPYYSLINKKCVRIDRCGVSNCKPASKK